MTYSVPSGCSETLPGEKINLYLKNYKDLYVKINLVVSGVDDE